MRPNERSFTLVYILGAGHCGSTLLSLLLNAHSRMLGLSEIQIIHRYASRAPGDGRENLLTTPFWQEVKKCYESDSDGLFADIDISSPSAKRALSYPPEECAEWAAPTLDLLGCIARESAADILVDSSKFLSRCFLLKRSGLFDLRVIHLIRDGRAVINSYARKYDNFRIGFRRWMLPSLAAFYLRHTSKPSHWLRIRYEDLATRPAANLRRICSYLGIEFEPGMLAYRKQPYYGIGGNRMAKGHDQEISLDTRWRQELPLAYRIKFSLLAGWLNRYYGYGYF